MMAMRIEGVKVCFMGSKLISRVLERRVWTLARVLSKVPVTLTLAPLTA